jgi:hypothetical protein
LAIVEVFYRPCLGVFAGGKYKEDLLIWRNERCVVQAVGVTEELVQQANVIIRHLNDDRQLMQSARRRISDAVLRSRRGAITLPFETVTLFSSFLLIAVFCIPNKQQRWTAHRSRLPFPQGRRVSHPLPFAWDLLIIFDIENRFGFRGHSIANISAPYESQPEVIVRF